MKSDAQELKQLITGMRNAFSRGENAMAWARDHMRGAVSNLPLSTLIAYDLQAGSYVADVESNAIYFSAWWKQLAEFIQPYVRPGDSILEVGVGEATTLSGVLQALGCVELSAFGFDLSWSRIHVAQKWLVKSGVNARLFTADLFSIPLADNSVDVVYTSHSLEPNGGREREAVAELLRVARKAVVLVEPLYELASDEAKHRMMQHGYVQGLKGVAERLGAKVVEYGLLDIYSNPLNPSGILIMTKSDFMPIHKLESFWQCPLTGNSLIDQNDIFSADQVGLVYPVVRSIPMLRGEHAIVASKIF